VIEFTVMILPSKYSKYETDVNNIKVFERRIKVTDALLTIND